MNELAIGRRKEAAIFRQQGTVKAEKQAPASAAQSTRKPASTAASDSVQQRMTGALRAEALTRESRRTLQSGEAILSEVQESLGRLAKLAEKAAGGGEEDRAALQKELEHLLRELDRMAESAAGGSSLFLPRSPREIRRASPAGSSRASPGPPSLRRPFWPLWAWTKTPAARTSWPPSRASPRRAAPPWAI